MKRLALSLAIAAVATLARADEGMWTFDAFPSDDVAQTYGVKIDQPWLDHVRASAVRLTSGCSGSVVSSEGLVLTNDHCVVDCTHSAPATNGEPVIEGFYAETKGQEHKCPKMQAEILETIIDLTPQIRAATRGKSDAAFLDARERALVKAEASACAGQPMRRCQVVPLYNGGQFKLYRYRKYDDVRLVFAPEHAAAFFGGDPDNFNFPRHVLDAAFLRLYENGAPARTPEHLRWTSRNPTPGEPVFVAGSPGSTERLQTMAQLETQRDLSIPVGQLQRSEIRGRLLQFAQNSPQDARLAVTWLFGVENAFKVYYGRELALRDKTFMAGKLAAEQSLRAKVAADQKLTAEIGDPWLTIEGAQTAFANHYLRYRQLELSAGWPSDLFDYARGLVRAAEERAKPSGQRLPEFADARLPLLRKQMLDAARFDTDLEVISFAFWLSKTREYLGADDPATTLLLGAESPEGLAERLVKGTKLADPAVRAALWDGGLAAIRASDDPLIQFVLKTDPSARQIRETWEHEVSGPVWRASADIGRARFAVEGATTYPDATFTLRLSYGKVDGWTYRGATIAPTTTISGLYTRATGAAPYALSPRWVAAKDKLAPATVLNFVTTNDIIGGNSGSPLLDAKGEVLGVVFDGNIHSLGGNYGYDPALNRTIAVSSAAITEALSKVYGRTTLVQELTRE